MARGSRGGRHAVVDGEYERDEIARNTQLKARCQRMEEQFEALTKQLAALAVINKPRNYSPTLHFVEEDEVDYNVEDEMENLFTGHRRRREKPLVSYNSNRWESGFKLDIPEFKGCLQHEEFLDWVAAVEEILEFKEMPQDKRVSLVATKFRGHAAAWWQQLKQSCIRQGKSKINTQEIFLKHMRATFLPHNYIRTLYQQLHNLKQGTQSIDEYTREFYQLVARVDLADLEDQLVSRYIGGMRQQFQDTLNLFDPISIS